MFKVYDLEVKNVLTDVGEGINWKDVLEKHKVMIKRIQHERLIHLLVTIFVGLSMVFSFLTTVVSKNSLILLLDIPLFILFIAYLFHYRFLENTTQSWYILEDKIKLNV